MGGRGSSFRLGGAGVKQATPLSVKSWFINKEFDSAERYAIKTVDPDVIKETEKAALLVWETKYGRITKWIPKSCIEGDIIVKGSQGPLTKQSYNALLKDAKNQSWWKHQYSSYPQSTFKDNYFMGGFKSELRDFVKSKGYSITRDELDAMADKMIKGLSKK